MRQFLAVVLSDYAIIIYEVIGIAAAIFIGKIFGKKIKELKKITEKEEHDRMYSELDSALKNTRRR
jgi:uncharacterized membrane protein YuzA (DUF378 family)